MKNQIKNISKRVISVDVLRGMCICLMLIVDAPVGETFEFCRHPVWTGFNLADFVFPCFITLMGVSIYFSLCKFEFKVSGSAIFRILRRFILLCVFGWLVTRISIGINAVFSGSDWIAAVLDFSAFRFMGVFQRIAICYLFASLIVLFVHDKRAIIAIIVILLVGYCVILGLGNGYEQSESNIISVVDRSIFSPAHMYQMKTYDGSRIALDPEGLLSNIPAIAQALLGFLIGGLIRNPKLKLDKKALYMLIIGASLFAVGLVMSIFIPAFKKAWTTPFVLTTAGAVFCLLSLFTWLIDIKGHKKWCKFFQVYGSNALISFAANDIVWLLIVKFNIANTIYDSLIPVFFGITGFAALVPSVMFILLWYIVLYVLDKNHIYIRL